jgi:hypothetical protein
LKPHRPIGLEGVTVRSAPDLAQVAHWVASDRSRALVVDAKVSPDVVAQWPEEAFRGHS